MKLLINGLENISFESFDYHGDYDENYCIMMLKKTCVIKNGQVSFLNEPVFNDEDLFYGDPEITSSYAQSDYVPFKPMLDFIILGDAYAPNGEPCEKFTCSVKHGDKIIWSVDVYGKRYWRRSKFIGNWEVSEVEPIAKLPLKYEHAYGGSFTYRNQNGEEDQEFFLDNIVGCGYITKEALKHREELIIIPQIVLSGTKISKPYDYIKPTGCSHIAKSNPKRFKYVGKLDKEWQENIAPKMPKEFDYKYWNSASEDFLFPLNFKGMDLSTPFVLKGFREDKNLTISLPKNSYRAKIKRYKEQDDVDVPFNLDTMVVDIRDENYLTVDLVWRGVSNCESINIKQVHIEEREL